MKDNKKILKNSQKVEQEISSYMETKHKLKPRNTSIRIALIYGAIGACWILFSGKLLYFFDLSEKTREQYEIYKGWFYVFITMLLIFYLVYKNVSLFEEALKKVKYKNEQLLETNQELFDLKENLSKMAYTDLLTGMSNKRAFERKIEEIAAKPDQTFTLVYMDVDNFKILNDTLGHKIGDMLLVEISKVLDAFVETKEHAFRISGDEFILLLDGVRDHLEIEENLNRLLGLIRKVWKLEEYEFFTTFSIGITIYPEDGINVTSLFRNADLAMYSVKRKMKDQFAYFSKELLEKSTIQNQMANQLRDAIQKKEFVLLYQPIHNLKENTLCGVEALIRWNHPKSGTISPMDFIPLAEETGLIYEIDKWVLHTAFFQKKEWEEWGYSPIKMSINISGKGLIREGLVKEIKELLLKTQVNSSEIQIEVTETALMENIDASAQVLDELHKMGIKIALDDFGTGYSSLTYLKELPIDVVKLDKFFIGEMIMKHQADVIVKAVIQLTHDLGLEIVAEGIETREQLNELLCKLCDYGQGYLFSKPIPKADMLDKMNMK